MKHGDVAMWAARDGLRYLAQQFETYGKVLPHLSLSGRMTSLAEPI